MPLAGCIDGEENEDEEQEEVFELQDWNVHFAVSIQDLPDCNETTNGRLYYVENDDQFQACKSTGWEMIPIQGEDGENGVGGQDGAQGPAGANGKTTLINILSSNNCPNGGYSFEVGTDDDDDGVLNSNEVSLVTDVCDGADGVDGQDGVQGPQGPAGSNGVDGQDGVQGPQGPAGSNGVDGQDGVQGPQGPAGSNGVDGQDGVQGPQGPAGNNGVDGQDGVQGPQGSAGSNGVDGQDGENGYDSLVNSYIIYPGDIDCSDGGTQLEIGTDFNGNGYLDPSEVTSTEKICNGVDGNDGIDGQDGVDGQTGPAGMAGTSSLITSKTEPAGSNCSSGGIKLGIGIDDNQDNQLQDSEIDNTLYVCDGNDGAAISIPWIDITGVPGYLMDGDNDTMYSGADFAVSGQQCAGGLVMRGINSVGYPICVIDEDTTFSGTCPTNYVMYGVSSSGMPMCSLMETYDGYDFAQSNQQCNTGQVMKGITSSGLVICVIDIDTDTTFAGQCPSGQVMRGVSSSGYAICALENTYDGYDFAVSDQTCTYGYSVYGINPSGQIICMQTMYYAGSGLESYGNTLQLSDNGCTSGEILKRNPGNYDWECVADEDTTYDGTNFATSDQVCANGQNVLGINANGDIICVLDAVNTYNGDDFALSDQSCPSGQMVRAISASGNLVCISDSDTLYDGYTFALSSQQCLLNERVVGINYDGTLDCAPNSNIGFTNVGVGGLQTCFSDGVYHIQIEGTSSSVSSTGQRIQISTAQTVPTLFYFNYIDEYTSSQYGDLDTASVSAGTVSFDTPPGSQSVPWMATLDWWTPNAPMYNHYSATIMHSDLGQYYDLICTVTEHSV